MNLDILSFDGANKFVPKENSYGIRIFDEMFPTPILGLKNEDKFLKVNSYYFNNIWPRGWAEFSWVDLDDMFLSGLLRVPWDGFKEFSWKGSKEGYLQYRESLGWRQEARETMFDDGIASRILDDYEKVSGVENVMIHCWAGKNRSPAVGIAMNEIYGWGFNDLKKEFPFYTRFIYGKMIEVAKKR